MSLNVQKKTVYINTDNWMDWLEFASKFYAPQF